MNKPYHLTQEQALEIAKEMDNHGFALTAYSDGSVEFHSAHVLAEYLNAALDKVLGEPVGYVREYAVEFIAKQSPNYTVINAESQANTDIALYAPKGLT
jgi:hypothetical protein